MIKEIIDKVKEDKVKEGTISDLGKDGVKRVDGNKPVLDKQKGEDNDSKRN